MKTNALKKLLLTAGLLGLSTSALSAAIITGSAVTDCVGAMDSQSLTGPGSVSPSCFFNAPNGNSTNAQASLNASAFGGGGFVSATGAISGVLGQATLSLSVTSQLILTGGTGAATLYPQFFLPAADPELSCQLLLDGSPAGCYGTPLNVTFNVPFTFQLTMSGSAQAGGSKGSSFVLTTQNGINGSRGGSGPFGVYQNGNPFVGATLAEVEVPEPVHGLPAVGLLTLYGLHRFGRKRLS